MDSIDCSKYYNNLGKMTLTDRWSRPPLPKQSSFLPIVCELCDMIVRDSGERMVAIFVLDKNGVPICVKTYPEIAIDSLRNEVMKLLYKMEFDPALVYKDSVRSHISLVLDAEKCERYKIMNTQTLLLK